MDARNSILKITFHPLFILFGILTAIFGGLTELLICALTALLHECGHIFYASKLGYECSKISLMPYGASAVCETDGIRPRDEIKLAVAGPAVNAFICILCAGLWWFFPAVYAFTDTVFFASAAMLVLNLLPAYPLDGGRVALCALCLFLSKRTAKIVLRILGGALAAALVTVFFTVSKNISLIAVALFLGCSVFERDVPLQRINYLASKPKRGKEIRHIMLNGKSTYKDALRYCDGGKYCIFCLYSDGVLDEICEDELYEMLQKHTIYDVIVEN